jgi:hypothetical protein
MSNCDNGEKWSTKGGMSEDGTELIDGYPFMVYQSDTRDA